MKLISWNVNGFRSILKKGFAEFFEKENADIFCIQEIKMQAGQADFETPGYHQYFHFAERKGYSGTGCFVKNEPISVSYGIEDEMHVHEGRVITLEYENYYVINSYVPNSQPELERLNYRLKWEDTMRAYLVELDKKKPIIYCGDLNVAHEEIDLKRPDLDRGTTGFTDQEREKLTELLNAGFCDTFRYLHPTETDAYTWWSYLHRARRTNAGWRIDYFIVSDRIKDRVKASYMYSDVMGSDHCPIGLEIDI